MGKACSAWQQALMMKASGVSQDLLDQTVSQTADHIVASTGVLRNPNQVLSAEQRRRLRKRRLLSLGFGGSSLLMTMIPLVNFLAMPVSVAGATAMWVHELKGRQQDS